MSFPCGSLAGDRSIDPLTQQSSYGNEMRQKNTDIDTPPSNYDSAGSPVPIASNIKLAGQTWDLFKGPNGDMTVFSFLPTGGKQVKSFKGDVNDFLKYLSKNQGLSASQYLKSVGAGTEPTLGENAVFTTDKYEVKVSYN